MSDHSHTPEPKADFFGPQKAGSLALITGIGGVAFTVISIVLAFGDVKQAAFSWLFALAFFFSIGCGALFWVLVHHATDAEWSVVIRRQLENLGSLLPLVGLFFVAGIIFFAPYILKWWNLDPATDHGLAHKAGYLNHTGFYIRAFLYFLGLGAVGFLVRRNSIRQDGDSAPVHTIRNRKLSFIGIPILGLSLTFAAVDWLMGLDYHWFSTMWGVYIVAGGAGSAISVLVLIVTALQRSGHLQVVSIEHYHIMGKLMLAFCVFWAYIAFSQYMLIWYANLPEETSYYIRRNIGSWWYLNIFLVVGRFFLPFPILLFQATKKNPKWICIVACWMILMHALDLYLVVLPMLHQTGASLALLDITSLLGMGGMLAAGYFWLLPKSSLFPTNDPRTPESIRLSN